MTYCYCHRKVPLKPVFSLTFKDDFPGFCFETKPDVKVVPSLTVRVSISIVVSILWTLHKHQSAASKPNLWQAKRSTLHSYSSSVCAVAADVLLVWYTPISKSHKVQASALLKCVVPPCNQHRQSLQIRGKLSIWRPWTKVGNV
jgi:hypothetical protein